MKGKMMMMDSTDNELLGSVQELSNVDDEDERLLGSNSKLNAAEGDNSSSGSSAFYGFDGDGNAVNDIGQESAHNIEAHQENDDYGEVMNDNASQIPSEACSKNPDAQEIQQSDLHENVGNMDTQGKLPSFTSTFMKVQGATKEKSTVGCANTLQQNTPVVQMTTVIHPPGTNVQMQMVMKGRLPSTSTSGSEADVPEVAEQVMMSRMASTQSSSMPSNTQSRIQASEVFHQQKPVQQSGTSMSQSSAFSGSQLKATVLKAKDQNVLQNIIHGPPKWKPIGGPQGDTQMLSLPTEEEPEEPHRDIKGDPFYSGVH